MNEEILINITSHESRVAVVIGGVLQEVYIERQANTGMVGNIYMGKVARVLPGMQAAFVDIGLPKAAFLHAKDMLQDDADSDAAKIADLVQEGQKLLVQIIKEPIGTKGPRITTKISLPSRTLVYMPDVDHVGISHRIEDETERERLKALVESLKPDLAGGFILRTAAEGATEADLQASINYLQKLWQLIQGKIKAAKAGTLIHEDLPLSLRALRDLVRPNTERVRIDNEEVVTKAQDFAQQLVPEAADKIEYHQLASPIFDLYGIENEIEKALQRKVELKSGGYLIIDQTEAMTTIDINTGAFVGSRNLDDTIFKTNLEAATSIARQLRLRNIGGIIIIDFIDMSQEDHKAQVMAALEKGLAQDHGKNKICEVSTLGLVEMTRKRTRESLTGVLAEICPTCGGRGQIKSAETVCYEIFREILRGERTYDVKSYLVLASQEVIDLLLDEESGSLAELEILLGKPISLQVEALYTQEQFDVVLM